MNENIEFYNEHAKEFFESTLQTDMSRWRNKFEGYVINGGRILDAGCGSGRDSKAFISDGFKVTAIDASVELCKLAEEYIGQKVYNILFEDISFSQEYDGIWACASLLHVENNHMSQVMKKISNALVSNGVIYASFKYGDGITLKGERSFYNFTEETVKDIFNSAGIIIEECTISSDVREGRGDEKWVNVIGRKNVKDNIIV